jgi:hypothetical protein
VVHGLKNQNFFPAVGANGPCVVHVNFGKAGFVFIEANVKKWGLAPVTGSLAPPPPYGSEQGSILLETGRKVEGQSSNVTGSPAHGRRHGGHGHNQSVHIYSRAQQAQGGLEPPPPAGPPASGHGRSRSGNFRVLPPTSPGPVRSPTDISLAQLVPTDEGESSAAANGSGTGAGVQQAGAPPEYTSPEHSGDDDEDSQGSSSDSEDRPLIHSVHGRRSRGATVTGAGGTGSGRGTGGSPPIPSYRDAVLQGAGGGRVRSGSAFSAMLNANQRERSGSGRRT